MSPENLFLFPTLPFGRGQGLVAGNRDAQFSAIPSTRGPTTSSPTSPTIRSRPFSGHAARLRGLHVDLGVPHWVITDPLRDGSFEDFAEGAGHDRVEACFMDV